MGKLKLKDGTIFEVTDLSTSGDVLTFCADKTLAECEEAFTKNNIKRIALLNKEDEYAVYTGFNATVITKAIDGTIEITVLAKAPSSYSELEEQLLETQEALAELFKTGV